jgi:hypothetical protein
VNDANVGATVGNGGVITANLGQVLIQSQLNQDASTKADGESVDPGAAGVGVAVAATRTDEINLAQVEAGGTVTADGITIDAGMFDAGGGDSQSESTSSAKSGS